MRPLTLQSRITLNYTLVPDYFLDNYMPKASGEFVKIYLYILRCFGSGTPAAACDVLKNGCASYSGSDDCFCGLILLRTMLCVHLSTGRMKVF